jgi:hypothetical protein
MTTYTFDAYAVYSSRTTGTIVGTETQPIAVSLFVQDGQGTIAMAQPVFSL